MFNEPAVKSACIKRRKIGARESSGGWCCEMWTILLTHYVVLLFIRHHQSSSQQQRQQPLLACPGSWGWIRGQTSAADKRTGRIPGPEEERGEKGMFKVAPRPAWPGQWGGGGMLRETGRVRRRLLTNLMCPTSLPSSSPHPSPLPLSLSARASSQLGLYDAIFSCISQQRVSCKC